MDFLLTFRTIGSLFNLFDVDFFSDIPSLDYEHRNYTIRISPNNYSSIVLFYLKTFRMAVLPPLIRLLKTI